jgi:hypothetical protein
MKKLGVAATAPLIAERKRRALRIALDSLVN